MSWAANWTSGLPSIGLGPGLLCLVGAVAILQMLTTVRRAASRMAVYRRQDALALEEFRERAALAADGSRQDDAEQRRAWQGARKFLVARKVREAEDIESFYLRPYDGKALASFEPGQHLTFELAVADQPRPVVRCYSLSDAPGDDGTYRVTIRRQRAPADRPEAPDGLGSTHFHESIAEGDTLNVRAPAGRFCLDAADTRPLVLIAGGVGVTPLISMLNAVLGRRKQREVWFFYGTKDRASLAFGDHLKQVAKDNRNVHVNVRFSRPASGDEKHKGRVTVDHVRKTLPDKAAKGAAFYICGPAEMMQTMAQGLRDWGVPEADIHFEAFGASMAKLRADSRPADEAAGGPARVITFSRSGRTASWSAEYDVLLDAAERNGVKLSSGCRAGQCGSCMVPILEGSVRHLVEPGVPLSEGHCLACVAVPETELVLDA